MYFHVHPCTCVWCVTGVVLHFSPHSTGDEIPKLLLEEAKLDPNAKNNYGNTPLHTACRNDNYTLAQRLVRDERCNPHEKDSKGDTALHVACRLTYSLGKRCNLHATVTTLTKSGILRHCIYLANYM